MQGLIDGATVALVVAGSAGYALLTLGPRPWRRRGLESAATLMARAPGPLRLAAVGRRLAAAARRGAGACGGCDSCATAPAGQATAGTEVRIAPGSIGRRRI